MKEIAEKKSKIKCLNTNQLDNRVVVEGDGVITRDTHEQTGDPAWLPVQLAGRWGQSH